PLRPVPLEIDANSQVQREFPGELEGIAPVDRFVNILVGGPCGLGHAAVSPISEKEGSKAVSPRERVNARRAAGATVLRVCRRHLSIEVVQSGRIVALIV